jgi:hypothetical protein
MYMGKVILLVFVAVVSKYGDVPKGKDTGMTIKMSSN